MSQSRYTLLRLLKALTSKELTAFSQFLGGDTKEYLLYEALQSLCPNFSVEDLNFEDVFEKVFPNKSYSKDSVTKLMSRLNISLERFLINERVSKNKWARQQMMLDILEEKGEGDYYFKTIKDGLKHWEKTSISSAKSLHTYQLQMKEYYHPDTNKVKYNPKKLSLMATNLDEYYIIEKLVFFIDASLRKNMLSNEASLFLYNELLDKGLSYPRESIIFILSQLVCIINDAKPKDEIFDVVEKLFTIQIDGSKELIKTVYITVLNIVGSLRLKDQSYNAKYLDIYDHGFQHGALLANGKVTEAMLVNYVVAAAHLHHFERAEIFLTQFEDKIVGSFPEESINLAYAYYNFHKGNYLQAVDYCNAVATNNDIQYVSRKKSLTLRAKFELLRLNQFGYDQLSTEVENFQKLVKRKEKKLGHKYDAYKNHNLILDKMVDSLNAPKSLHKARLAYNKLKKNDEPLIAPQWFAKHLEEEE